MWDINVVPMLSKTNPNQDRLRYFDLRMWAMRSLKTATAHKVAANNIVEIASTSDGVTDQRLGARPYRCP